MRALVIGADGQLGHELLRRLPGAVGTTRSGRLPDGRACIALDVTDTPSLCSAIRGSGADIVLNAAAYTAVDKAETEQDLAFAINAAAPRCMAETCVTAGIPLVHFSTDYVFRGNAVRPLTESDATGPISVYGASKLAGEQAVLSADASAKVFRLCWVYGTRGRNFLLTMLRLAAERDELRVVADQFGCPTPAAWIAEAVVRAVTTRPDAAGVFHLAAAGSTSWHGFAAAIVEEAHGAGLIAKVPKVTAIGTADYTTAATRPAHSVLDSGRFAAAFGVRLRDWRAGVREVIAEITRQKSR